MSLEKNTKNIKTKGGIMDKTKTHIILYSGGLASYFTAKRVIERLGGSDGLLLLFTDTKTEDEDLYVFLEESSNKLGVPITKFSDGRNIWEVFKESRMIGNSRVDLCSETLKRKMSRKFVSRFNPEEVVIYLGFDWSEMDRFERAKKAWLPYKIESPLLEKPYIDREEMKNLLYKDGIKLPRLYSLGFEHNNCGGGCIKAGVGHFALLLERFPERFAEWEENEKNLREYIGKDVSILRKKRNGKDVNLTLEMLRKERNDLTPSDLSEIGGCGCFQK